MNRITFLAILLLSGCQLRNVGSTRGSSEVTTRQNVAQNVAPEFLVSADGIGLAKLGMTLGELKRISARNTEFKQISSFAPHFNAIAVSKESLVQYYILYKADSEDAANKFVPSNNDSIAMLITNNYNYQTQEGIKVGMPIKEAENVYGDAMLAYNTDGESVEYITFNDYEAPNIKFTASYFKLISDGLGFAGIYPEYPGAAYTTDKYQSDAAIAAIEVSCSENTCSQHSNR